MRCLCCTVPKREKPEHIALTRGGFYVRVRADGMQASVPSLSGEKPILLSIERWFGSPTLD